MIGCSLISALLCGTRALRNTPAPSTSTSSKYSSRAETTLVTCSSTKSYALRPAKTADMDVQQLVHDAYLSSRLCSCEGIQDVCKAAVQVCEICGHTACKQHAGHPEHVYTKMIPRSTRTQTPYEFLKKWKDVFPARLKVCTFPDVRGLVPKTMASNKLLKKYLERMQEAQIEFQYFTIGSIEREEAGWSVKYISPRALLRVRIASKVELNLFVLCPSSLRGDDDLRKVLEQPVARAVVDTSLLNARWEVFIPYVKSIEVKITASADTTDSWKNRLGLPDFKTETTPRRLDISSEAVEARDFTGEFNLQMNCGTACDSMYKREKTTGSGPDLFFYLDPDLVGHPKDDTYVFTYDLSFRAYGETRVSLACLDASWRPWRMDAGSTQLVQATTPGIWVASHLVLESASLPMDVSVPSTALLTNLAGDCARAITILDVKVPDLRKEGVDSTSWILNQAKPLLTFSDWQATADTIGNDCECAPHLPPLLWHVDGNGTATAHEEPKAAASFERAMKFRRPIFKITTSATARETRVQLGLNVASLIHRAQGRLPKGTACQTAWRLCSDHAESHTGAFPKFTLQCNAASALFAGKLTLMHNLDKAQLRSLAWMITQEVGRSITVTEIEEAVESDLGVRAEARAQHSYTIHGGVLADRPSFGKTVTTIALIQSEFQQNSPDVILKHLRSSSAALPALRPLAATLIVCPPQIAQQWKSELEKFLGTKQFDAYKVLLIQDYESLQRLTIDAFQASRIVVLSWTVLSDPNYVAQLARFAAMPEPATCSGSGFDAWLKRTLENLPERLSALASRGIDDFRANAKDLLQERLSQQAEFQAVIPIKLGHGKAYEPYEKMRSTASSTKRPKTKTKVKTKSARQLPEPAHAVPLLHLFRFNRVVVDEYHYLLDDRRGENYPAYAGVKSIAAPKRWVLSGTPALTNFSDVNEIASFLGVKLGRNVCGDGLTMTPFEKNLMEKQTEVQKFLSRTEILSLQWHRARHERAQGFLDEFVRKNKPTLDHIKCVEVIQPMHLDITHNAVYLELARHLIAHRMQLKKAAGKATSDRADRLNAMLDNSATAEDALLKCALLFNAAPGVSGIDTLIEKRSMECAAIEEEIKPIAAGLLQSRRANYNAVIDSHINSFEDYVSSRDIGDGDASARMCQLLVEAAQDNETGRISLQQLKGLSGDKKIKSLKNMVSRLRDHTWELVVSTRSLRFITAMKGLIPVLSGNKFGMTSAVSTLKCNSEQCTGVSSVHELRLVTECGHLACVGCLKSRSNEDICVNLSCNASVSIVDLVNVTDLGTPTEQIDGQGFGTKLADIARLVGSVPKEEQGIIFVPNHETISILEKILKHHDISYHALSNNKKQTVKLVEDFKNNEDVKKRKKVLILDLGSESAAGL